MTEPTAPAAAATPFPKDIRLPIEGVALAAPGTEGWVGLTGFDGVSPKLTVNGVAKTGFGANRANVPMADGSVGKLKISAILAGYPRVDFNGARVFTTPVPPAGESWIVFFPLLIIFSGNWILGAVGAVLVHNFAASLLKKRTMSAGARVATVVGVTLAASALNFIIAVAIAASLS